MYTVLFPWLHSRGFLTTASLHCYIKITPLVNKSKIGHFIELLILKTLTNSVTTFSKNLFKMN